MRTLSMPDPHEWLVGQHSGLYSSMQVYAYVCVCVKEKEMRSEPQERYHSTFITEFVELSSQVSGKWRTRMNVKAKGFRAVVFDHKGSDAY
jgi:hypothetical protein